MSKQSKNSKQNLFDNDPEWLAMIPELELSFEDPESDAEQPKQVRKNRTIKIGLSADLILGLIFSLAALVISLESMPDSMIYLQLLGSDASTAGEVVSKEIDRRISTDSSGSHERIRYIISFEYVVNEQLYLREAKVSREFYEVVPYRPLTIIYDPNNPSVARIAGSERIFDWALVNSLVFTLLLAALFFYRNALRSLIASLQHMWTPNTNRV